MFWNNSLMTWSTAAGVALVVFAGLMLFFRVLRGRFARLVKDTAVMWDDLVVAILTQTKRFTLLVVSVFVGTQFVTLPARATEIVNATVAVVLLLQAGIWGTAAIRFLIQHHLKSRLDDGAAITSMRALSLVARLVLWSVVALLVLDNLGVDITALVAGLGVGGIAVALAVQNILGDLFASLSIALDKPFVHGDAIKVGEHLGTVEHVGLKTTRIRSLSGEQLVFSNADLLSSRIQNHGRLNERRVSFTIGVTYDTPRDKLRQIPEIVKSAVEAQGDARFGRSHFKAFGDSALLFDSVYYVVVPDYDKYMDVQEEINFAIHEQFETLGIEFAFPTQTLHVLTDSAGQ